MFQPVYRKNIPVKSGQNPNKDQYTVKLEKAKYMFGKKVTYTTLLPPPTITK